MLTSCVTLIRESLGTWPGLCITVAGLIVLIILFRYMLKNKSPFMLMYILFTVILTVLLMISSSTLVEHFMIFYNWIKEVLSR